MKAYLDIVRNVLYSGILKGNRTGVRTLALPNQIFSHEMSDGFPLLTTKKMPIKTIAVELEGFIKGITSKKWYQERNCYIWDEWANPKAVKRVYEEEQDYLGGTEMMGGYPSADRSMKQIQKDMDDLGPIYGYQWRHFGEVYDENDSGPIVGYDQLKNIVDMLHKNPNDRRMVCSSWNPAQIDRMALPPCNFAWNLMHCNGVLNLCWVQRSCDLMLGVPFNIASYALLLTLLCKEANMTPGNLTGVLVDCHIYENHVAAAEEQLRREPRKLPNIEVWDTAFTDKFDIFNWDYNALRLINYNPHPKLPMEVAI